MRLTALVLAALAAAPADPIDRRIEERWKAEGATPAGVADDYEFFRRLSIDLRGVIPEPAEIRAFAADRAPDKRERIVDAWLRSDAFAAWWSHRWAEDLTVQPTPKIAEVSESFRGWLRDAVRTNMPYDRFARRLLTAKGPSDLDPAAGFLVTGFWNNPEGPKDVIDRTARIFLGTQIRCAECHDHPFDAWTQEEFYGMASFLWQVRTEISQNGGAMMAAGTMAPAQTGRIVDDAAKGNPAIPGASKETGAPKYKDGGAPLPGEPRRTALARLLVQDRQFARAAVNRHWGMLLGRGLVHPLDGFTSTRKPSHPELLDEMAEEFVRSGYDVRKLLRSILLSRPYQLSSKSGDSAAERIFARTPVTPLGPDALFSSLVRATGLDGLKVTSKGKPEPPLKGLREAFLREFRPAAPSEPTISQGLFFMNSDVVARGVKADPDLRLGKLLASEPDPARRLEELFLATLSRPPSPKEAKAFAAGTASECENVLWALLNSTEFVTRH